MENSGVLAGIAAGTRATRAMRTGEAHPLLLNIKITSCKTLSLL